MYLINLILTYYFLQIFSFYEYQLITIVWLKIEIP